MNEEPRSEVRERKSKVQPVIDRLKSIPHDVVGPLLDTKHGVDPSAGIVLVNLDVSPVSANGFEFHFHGARVLTGEGNFVKPHYHEKGEEPYHILKGKGEMNLGEADNDEVKWKSPKEVMPGDVIEVQEHEVHSLRNPGETPLDFTFACPDEHLVDNSPEHPEGDRFFTMDLQHGTPPWYPKQ